MHSCIIINLSSNRAILSVLFTSVLFNDAFHSLPDTQQAKLSATRVSKLLSHQPVIDAFSDNGIILVRFIINLNCCLAPHFF